MKTQSFFGDDRNIDIFLLATIDNNNHALPMSTSLVACSSPVDFAATMNQLEKQLLVASRAPPIDQANS